MLEHLTIGLVIGCGVMVAATDGVACLWRRLRPPTPPPAKWTVTITDPDGIPTRSDSLSVEAIARLIRDINSGFYK